MSLQGVQGVIPRPSCVLWRSRPARALQLLALVLVLGSGLPGCLADCPDPGGVWRVETEGCGDLELPSEIEFEASERTEDGCTGVGLYGPNRSIVEMVLDEDGFGVISFQLDGLGCDVQAMGDGRIESTVCSISFECSLVLTRP